MKGIQIRVVLVVSVLLLIIVVSCRAETPIDSGSSSPQTAPLLGQESIPRPEWQAEWEKLVEMAKKERVVTVNSSIGVGALGDPFKQEFGITMENVVLSGANMSPRISAERRAGIYTVDVGLIGLNTGFDVLKPAGFLDSLEPVLLLPEVTDPRVWYKSEVPFADYNGKTVISYIAFSMPPIAINTNLVKSEEIKSYRDLLDPRWKGKIVFYDPTKPGSGNSAFIALSEIMGYDYLRELGQQIQILTDLRLMIEWLAHGKVAIVLAPSAPQVIDFLRTGAPIATLIPSEGTWLTPGSGNVALLNKAPHPHAARVFINWLLTKKGQTLISKVIGYPSARVDVPRDFVPSFMILNPAVKYLDTKSEEYTTQKGPEATKRAKEMYGPLLK